jgi:glycosyltransferase involved in cell wall biosynthesis
VSIGLTVYNGEQYLEETLDAFLAQTFSDFELILSDNASTDRTPAIAESYVARDCRIRYHRNEKNLGLAGNHNCVVQLARGEYFKWAAADDVCLPEYLARCVEVLDREPTVVLAYPRTQFVDFSGSPLSIDDPGWNLRSDAADERFLFTIFAGHWANAVVGLIRRESLEKTRLMPAYPGGDYRVLSELSLLGKFYEIPEVLFMRRLHPGATSQHGTGGATPDQDWLVKCWKGSGSRVSAPTWSLSLDRLRAIVSARLPLGQKMFLARSLLRHAWWQRGKLYREFLNAAAGCVARGRGVAEPVS